MPDVPRNRRAATEDEARALASGVRLRIIRLCLDHALTNKEIAERLGANAATTLHHVRKLVATGFLIAGAERRGTRGAREVPYRSTGKSWTLSVGNVPVEGSGRAMVDAFLDEISHIDIDALWSDDNAHPNRIDMMRLGLRLPVAHLNELAERMAELLNEYAELPRDLDGSTPVSIFVAVYPDVTRDGPPTAS